MEETNNTASEEETSKFGLRRRQKIRPEEETANSARGEDNQAGG